MMTADEMHQIRFDFRGKGRCLGRFLLKNAFVFDVFNCRYEMRDVAVLGDTIAGVGEYSGDNEIDLTGKYLIPGLIDSHVHIESSYLTPAAYAGAVMPKGVTTVIADPHEIVNVCGESGLEFMMKSAGTVPLDVKFMMPSCVPATPFDSSGCNIDAAKTAELMQKFPFHGLGEMMNYPGVLSCDGEVLAKLDKAGIIDGHAPAVAGKDLCAYIASGISTDHEIQSASEAAEKIGLGMYVHMRHGTLVHNAADLCGAVNSANFRRFCLCTDDKHIDDILENGTVTDCINAVTKAGISPETAICMATLNAAECYKLGKVGAIAPGYKADIVVCGAPDAAEILSVYKNGVKVAENGRALFNCEKIPTGCGVENSVNIKRLNPGDLVCDFDPEISVIKVSPDTLYIERHRASGNIGRAFVEGIKLNGAVAQTIGHDSHNITVLGDNDSDMRLAAEALGCEGGIAVTQGGCVIGKLTLGIGGVMSGGSAGQVAAEYLEIVKAVGKISGGASGWLLMAIAFLPLLVIPELRLSDKGLFDVKKFMFIK